QRPWCATSRGWMRPPPAHWQNRCPAKALIGAWTIAPPIGTTGARDDRAVAGDRRQRRAGGALATRGRGALDCRMQLNPDAAPLRVPYASPPNPGALIEIAPGLQWFRLPLPYRLDHVNIYLIRHDDAWAVLDTGLGTDACRAVWDAILSGPLDGQRLTSMIVT